MLKRTVKLDEKCGVCRRTKRTELEEMYDAEVLAAYDENSDDPLATLSDCDEIKYRMKDELVGAGYRTYVCEKCRDIMLGMLLHADIKEFLGEITQEAAQKSVRNMFAAAARLFYSEDHDAITITTEGHIETIECMCGNTMEPVLSGFTCRTCNLKIRVNNPR